MEEGFKIKIEFWKYRFRLQKGIKNENYRFRLQSVVKNENWFLKIQFWVTKRDKKNWKWIFENTVLGYKKGSEMKITVSGYKVGSKMKIDFWKHREGF